MLKFIDSQRDQDLMLVLGSLTYKENRYFCQRFPKKTFVVFCCQHIQRYWDAQEKIVHKHSCAFQVTGACFFSRQKKPSVLRFRWYRHLTCFNTSSAPTNFLMGKLGLTLITKSQLIHNTFYIHDALHKWCVLSESKIKKTKLLFQEAGLWTAFTLI